MSRSTFCLLVSPLMSIFKFYDITIKLFALSFNKNLSILTPIESDISSIVVVFFCCCCFFSLFTKSMFCKKELYNLFEFSKKNCELHRSFNVGCKQNCCELHISFNAGCKQNCCGLSISFNVGCKRNRF